MVATNPLSQESFWFNKAECDDAEKVYYQTLYGNNKSSNLQGSIAADIAIARQQIKNSLECVSGLNEMAGNQELLKKVLTLEEENKCLKKVTDDLKNLVIKLDSRVAQLEKGGSKSAAAPAKGEEEEDDDVDLFGSDSEDEESKAEKERVTAERLKAYHAKKAKKPALIAKTSVLLDIKPWDDETDMDEMLKQIKTITKEGLVWGASKLVPVGFGINKLQLMCVVEDDKVSVDELQEQIEEFKEYVQSTDIAAMSKI